MVCSVVEISYHRHSSITILVSSSFPRSRGMQPIWSALPLTGGRALITYEYCTYE
jgi:hypothetical protein